MWVATIPFVSFGRLLIVLLVTFSTGGVVSLGMIDAS